MREVVDHGHCISAPLAACGVKRFNALLYSDATKVKDITVSHQIIILGS